MHKIFEFLFSLERVKLDDLSRLHLNYDWQDFSLLILLVLVVFGVLGFWSYRGQSAAPRKQVILGILRGLTLIVLAMLCLRPHLVLEEAKPLPSVVAVWIDDSLPMALRDPYKDPALRLQAQNLMQTLNATQATKGKWPMRWDLAIDTLLHDKGLHALVGGNKPATQPAAAPAVETQGVDWHRVGVAGVIFALLAAGVVAFLFSGAVRGFSGGQRLAMGTGALAVAGICLGIYLLMAPGRQPEGDPMRITQEVAVFTGHDEAIAQGRATTGEQLDMILNRIKDTVPRGERTDIPKVVKRIFSDLQGQPVSSIIMMTDGRSSAGAEPLPDAVAIAKARGTPLISYPMGSLDPLQNAAITRMDVPADVFVKDPVQVKVGVEITADEAGTAKVTLYRRPAGATDDKNDVVLKGADGKDVTATVAYAKATREKPVDKQEVELIFKPLKIEGEKEDYHLVAKLDPVGEELTEADNVADAHTTVMDTRINVLYVEGYPRWEYRYLKNELLREPTINLSVLLLSADETFSQEGTVRRNPDGSIHKLPDGSDDVWTIQRFPETEAEMLKYDVILLGDVEPEFFSPMQMELILNFVKKHGGGIGWIAGDQYNPNSYRGTALLPLLPIDPDDALHPTLPPSHNEAFEVTATPEGYDTPLFRFFDKPEDNKEQMKNNPSLYWYKPVLGTHGPVQVLAVNPTEQIGGQPVPLLVYGQYGDGRVLFSGIADTWRWRYYKGEPLYQSYWLQVCRMLYAGRIMGQNHKVLLEANGRSATVNEPMPLTVTLHDPTMLPTAPAQLTVLVTDDSGNPLEPVVLSRVGENGNTYKGELTSSTVGKLRLQLTPGSLSVDPMPMELTVGLSNDAVTDPTVDIEALTTLANETKGDVLTAEHPGDLTKLIANRSVMMLKSIGEDLWTKPFALAIIVLLVTIEWLMRKKAGLI